jgi:hypothetical protein
MKPSALASLFLLLALLGSCQRPTAVDPEAGRSVATGFWDALKANDVPRTIAMFDSFVWSPDPELRARWSHMLTALSEKNGAIGSVEPDGSKWFPGSELVSDHRPFVCYAYTYKVHRATLDSREQLIVCGEPKARPADMRLYGHALVREDTQQQIRVGADYKEKAL